MISASVLDISVIIPTFNRVHVLERAIVSVLAQTLAPREVIVVDDGSEDSTRALLRSRFPQCRYLHQPNRGVSSARNHGIREAGGAWLAFLDSDDAWLPGKLAAQQAELVKNPAHRLCHTEEIWIRNGRRVNAMHKHAKSGGFIFQQCLPLCVISPSSAIIRRDLFQDTGLFDESLPACEDYDLWLRICAREPVAFARTPQIEKYGGHDDQLSRRYWGMDRFRIRALEKVIAGSGLAAEDRVAAIQMVIEKSGIMANGARKRGAIARMAQYLAIQRRYQTLLAEINGPCEPTD